MAILLTQADVEDLIDLPEAIACMEQVFVEQSQGSVEAWPPSSMWSGGQYLGLRAGGLSAQHRVGLRVNTLGEAGGAYAMVFESPSGKLLSVMEAPFSDLRLTAVAAIAIRQLAPAEAHTVAMIGTGKTASAILPGAPAARPVERVRVYSPNPDHRAGFAERMARQLDLSVAPIDDARRAVEGADLVLVATNARQPVLQYEWLSPRALVIAVGTRMEVDAEVFGRADLVVTTSRVHEFEQRDLTKDAAIVRARDAGALDWDAVVELGEIVAARRQPPEGMIVFHEPRGGFTDVALACRAYERAIALGRGAPWLDRSANRAFPG